MLEPLPGLGAALGLEHPTAEQWAGAGWSSRGSVPCSSSPLCSRPSSIHLAGLKPNYQPMGSAGRGMVPRWRCPLALGDGDGAIGSLMASSQPCRQPHCPGCGGLLPAWGAPPAPRASPAAPAPCLTGWHLSTPMPSVCLSVCLWVLDRQHGVAESLAISWRRVPWGWDGDGTPLC